MNDKSEPRDQNRDAARWSAEDAAALRALSRTEDPGRLLEERTVHALRDRGLLAATAPSRTRTWTWAAAAAIAFFVVGFALGRGTGAATSSIARGESGDASRAVAGDPGAGETDIAQTVLADSAAAGARFVVWF